MSATRISKEVTYEVTDNAGGLVKLGLDGSSLEVASPLTGQTQISALIRRTIVEVWNVPIEVLSAPLPDNLYEPTYIDQFTIMPKDADGNTIIPTPTADSNLMYVSADGDDATGEVYSLATLPGGTWDNPTGIMPFKTPSVAAGSGRIRAGQQDYLLSKHGDYIQVSGQIAPPKGKSLTERHVIACYGNPADGMAQWDSIDISASSAIDTKFSQGGNLMIIGIDYLNTRRNPNHVNFVGWPNIGTVGSGALVSVGARLTDINQGVLIERCRVSYGTANGVGYQALDTSTIKDLVIRRNVIQYNYSSDPNAAEVPHSQGIGATNGSALIEENLLIANGYSLAPGSTANATIYNHNIYLEKAVNTIIRNNISIRPSAQHVKSTANSSGPNTVSSSNVIQYGNLKLYGSVVTSMGGNQTSGDGARFENMEYKGNIIQYIGKEDYMETYALGPELSDNLNSQISDNLFLGVNNASVTNRYWVSLTSWQSGVEVNNNIVNDFGGVASGSASRQPGPVGIFGNITDTSLFVNGSASIDDYAVSVGYADLESFIGALSAQYVETLTPALTMQAVRNWFKQQYTLSVANDIVITSQPQDAFIYTSGDAAGVSVGAYSQTPIAYQWCYGDGSIITGETGRVLGLSVTGDTTVKVVMDNGFTVKESAVVNITLSTRSYSILKNDSDNLTTTIPEFGGTSPFAQMIARGQGYKLKYRSNLTGFEGEDVSTVGESVLLGNGDLRFSWNPTIGYRILYRYGTPYYNIDINAANLNDGAEHTIEIINPLDGDLLGVTIDGVFYPTIEGVTPSKQNIAVNNFRGSSLAGDVVIYDIEYFSRDSVTLEDTQLAFYAVDDALTGGATAPADVGTGSITYNVSA